MIIYRHDTSAGFQLPATPNLLKILPGGGKIFHIMLKKAIDSHNRV